MTPLRASIALALSAFLFAPPAAPDSAMDARRSKVALTIGKHSVTVGELEDRLKEIPPFQIAAYGATNEEVVKAYVDQVIVRDLVLIAGAEERKIDQDPATKQLLTRAKSSATLRALRGPFKSSADIPLAEVAKYYADNRSRYDSPERVNLWRILCKSQDEAASVIAAAKRELTIPKWTDLSREHSIDKATNLRGGNLGFLAADGTSNEAGVKADPNLVKAAASVKDGDLVPDPIAEGANYAVIWRRTTTAPARRTLEEADAQIRATLFRQRTEANEKKMIEDLRAKNVTHYNVDPLKIVVLPALDAGLSLPRSIPSAPR